MAMVTKEDHCIGPACMFFNLNGEECGATRAARKGSYDDRADLALSEELGYPQGVEAVCATNWNPAIRWDHHSPADPRVKASRERNRNRVNTAAYQARRKLKS